MDRVHEALCLAQSTEFTKNASDWGVAVACLIALGTFVGAVLIWFARCVAAPLVTCHVDAVKSVTETARKQADTLERIAETLNVQAKVCGDHGKELAVIRVAVEEMKKPGNR